MATHTFIFIKEGNKKGKQYKCKLFFSSLRTHTPGTFLLCWQLLLRTKPGAECGVVAAKRTETNRGFVLKLMENREHVRTVSRRSYNIWLYAPIELKPPNIPKDLKDMNVWHGYGLVVDLAVLD